MNHCGTDLCAEHVLNWDGDEGCVKAGAADASWQVQPPPPPPPSSFVVVQSTPARRAPPACVARLFQGFCAPCRDDDETLAVDRGVRGARFRGPARPMPRTSGSSVPAGIRMPGREGQLQGI